MEEVDLLLENLAKISLDSRGEAIAGGYKKAEANTQQSLTEPNATDQIFSS